MIDTYLIADTLYIVTEGRSSMVHRPVLDTPKMQTVHKIDMSIDELVKLRDEVAYTIERRKQEKEAEVK